jgi:hypothetical protein
MGNLTNTADYQEIRKRISQLTSQTAGLWGKMNVRQMVCHVSDPIRDAFGMRNTKPAVPAIFRPILKMMLFSKKPFGKNLPTMKPFLQDDKGGGSKPAEFEADKKVLLELVDRFHATDSNYSFHPHPGVGKLSREQNGFLVWKHLDHHLRQFGV